MKRYLLLIFLVIVSFFIVTPILAQNDDPLTPDSIDDQIQQQQNQQDNAQNNAQQEAETADQVMLKSREKQGLLKKWAVTDKEFIKARDESPDFVGEQYLSWMYLISALHLPTDSILGSQSTIYVGGVPTTTQTAGAVHLAGNMVTQMVSRPPTSSVEYIADLGNRLHLVSPAYAQDTSTGYQGLQGVLSIWQAFRNLAYAFFVIIFVVVGFMIMFRAKLNPQTTVSLQMALPKLILTLILITFSYAIAGLVIDLIYLTIYLSVNIFKNFYYPSPIDASSFLKTGFPELIQNLQPAQIADYFSQALNNLFPKGTPAGTVTELATKEVILGYSLIKLIVAGAILFSILKLLFQLILAYINIIIQVIFAPILLLFNALPNSQSFNSWIRNLLANAAAFPAAALMILIGSSLTHQSAAQPQLIGQTFAPPFLGFFGDSQQFITGVIGLGVILMLPQVVKIIQEALKAKPAMPAGPAIVEGLGGAIAMPAAFFRSRREARHKRHEAQYQAQQIGQEMSARTPK